MSGQRRPLTLLRGVPVQPAHTGLADRGLEALMILAVEEIRACREVIGEAGPGESEDLRACTDRLGSLDEAIHTAAMSVVIAEMPAWPVPSHGRPRRLRAVRHGTPGREDGPR